VHIERYIPQHLLYPHCTPAVLHGGSGTMISALWHRLPLVIMPLGADQPANATSAQAAAVAQVLDPERMTPEQVRGAVCEILTRSEYRDNARRIQSEMGTLPAFAQGSGCWSGWRGGGRPCIPDLDATIRFHHGTWGSPLAYAVRPILSVLEMAIGCWFHARRTAAVA